jgi:uncharacterized membrane protein YphA (DoxX/SURF4 family)
MRASGAVVLIRLYVGLIFAGEGILKFLRPDALGPGRFIKAGIPAARSSPTSTGSSRSAAVC